jgi:hypothetical protein
MFPWLLGTGTAHYYRNVHLASTGDARREADSAVEPLKARIDSLELACAGMWELLKFKLNCTEDELIAAIQTVDARDGVMDGKITPQAGETCPSCHRKLLTRTGPRCSWCGEPLVRVPF